MLSAAAAYLLRLVGVRRAPAGSTRSFILTVVGLYLLFTGMAFALRPEAYTRYVTASDPAFDADYYQEIIESGYRRDAPWNTAFYPLWPLVARYAAQVFAFRPTPLFNQLLSLLVFFASLPPLLSVLQQRLSEARARFWLVLYVLNPHSIFHAIAYAESLFCLEASLLLFAMSKWQLRPTLTAALGLFGLSALASVTRPIFVSLVLTMALLAVVAITPRKSWVSPITSRWRLLSFSTLMLLGAAIGYLPYGLYCREAYGSFWQPFVAQGNWGRKLGIYWSVIISPEPHGGSPHILFWDLLAFYGPILITVAAIWRKAQERQKVCNSDLLFWYSVFYSASFGVVNLLTFPHFLSIGRHVFSAPFMFYALGALEQAWAGQESARASKARLILLVFTSYYFVYWWIRYARLGWMG